MRGGSAAAREVIGPGRRVGWSFAVSCRRCAAADHSFASSLAWSFACSRALGFTEGLKGTFDTVA